MHLSIRRVPSGKSQRSSFWSSGPRAAIPRFGMSRWDRLVELDKVSSLTDRALQPTENLTCAVVDILGVCFRAHVHYHWGLG